MSQPIRWRVGCHEPLISAVREGANPPPPYVAGRGLGENWPLPALNTTNAPLRMAPEALPALVSAYEEYIDRYLVEHDYDVPPRRWLHDNIPAEPGVLEFVFPLLKGSASAFVAEVLLIRLVWLIQQCPGLVPYTSPSEIIVTTTVGQVGIRGGSILYRFQPGGVKLINPVVVACALSEGHIRVFSNAMNRLYKALDGAGKSALTLLAMRLRTKTLLRRFYDDGLVTGGMLSSARSMDDKILNIELALQRSTAPADTLMKMLVPEHLTMKEFRTLFRVPWAKHERSKVTSDYLIRKMPLVRKILSCE